MPRTGRAAPDGYAFHVLNRGNNRARIFLQPADYEAFLRLMADAAERVPMRVLAFCLMPNHWHLVLWPLKGVQLSAYLQWLLTVHVLRYHRHRDTIGHGHIYQGRSKRFPIQTDRHLLAVARYVEANPVRAQLVPRAEDWRWSSLSRSRTADGRALLSPWPIEKPANWAEIVNAVPPTLETEQIRRSVRRGRPCGDPQWVQSVAGACGLHSTLRPVGRPRKNGDCPHFSIK
jgi:putative transposase